MRHNPSSLANLAGSPDPITRLRALRLMRYQIAAGQPPAAYLELARSLIGDPDDDCRWQAVQVVSLAISTNPEFVWQVVCDFGSSNDEDMRDAIATVLLADLLGQDCERYYPRLRAEIAQGSPLLADTLARSGHP